MIHIEGQNISPFRGNDPRRYQLSGNWQEKLGTILKAVVGEWTTPISKHLINEEVTCYFAPNATPTVEHHHPPALLIVRMSKFVPSGYGHLNDYAERLGKACKQFLNDARCTTDARVNVVFDLYDPENGYYSTPPKE